LVSIVGNSDLTVGNSDYLLGILIFYDEEKVFSS